MMNVSIVMVLVDAGFFKLIGSTFKKIIGAIPLDQSDKSEGDTHYFALLISLDLT